MALSGVKLSAIRHLTPPREDRRLTDKAFCEIVDISEDRLGYWQYQDKEFKAALAVSRESYESDPDYFRTIARHLAIEEMVRGTRSREEVQRRQWTVMLLKETADLRDGGTTVDYSQHTDAELLDLAIARDVRVANLTNEQLIAARDDLEGESCKQPSSASSVASAGSSSSSSGSSSGGKPVTPSASKSSKKKASSPKRRSKASR